MTPRWGVIFVWRRERIRRAGVSKGHSAAFAPAPTKAVEAAKNPSLCAATNNYLYFSIISFHSRSDTPNMVLTLGMM